MCQLMLLYVCCVLLLVAFIALQVGIIYLYSLQLLLAYIKGFYCSAKLMLVPTLVLFCSCLVCNQFLVISASYVDIGAYASLLRQTVATSTSNRMLLLSVSATRQQYSYTLYAALAFTLSFFLIGHQQLYALCLPQQAAHFLGIFCLSLDRQSLLLCYCAQQLYAIIALHQVSIQLQCQHLKHCFTQHCRLYCLHQKTLPCQIRPLLIILLAFLALLNSIITLEAAFVGALRVSYLTYLISTCRINGLLSSRS